MQIKTFFSFKLAVLCVAFFYSQVSLSALNTLDTILKRGVLVVAMTKTDQPPFYYERQGRLQGFDVDLAQNIASELGVEVKFNRRANSFDEVVSYVVSGKADIAISKLSKTLSRSKVVVYTDPYLKLRQAVLINRLNLAKIGDESPRAVKKVLLELDKAIGVIKDSSYVNYAERFFPKANIMEYETWDRAIESVFTGNIFMAYRDELEVKKILKKYPDAQLSLKTVLFEDTVDNIAMAVSVDNQVFVHWLNTYLESNYKRPTINELLTRYKDIF